MVTLFDDINGSARVWIYQTGRALSSSEQELIQTKANRFISSWAAHGQDLLASATILHDHFLVISADESFNMASGCSIDGQFRFVRDLAEELSIDFFNRMNIAFLINDTIKILPMAKIKSEIENGNIHPESTFFDNNIQTIEDLKNNWVKTARDSWLSRYFKTQKNVL